MCNASHAFTCRLARSRYASKGFVSTLELQGKITFQLKLDWIFVEKSFHPRQNLGKARTV
jgi:hypothetical protein